MSDYKFMDPVVDELCESMVKNPERWEITTYTLNDRKSGVQYWIANGWRITETWSGRSGNTVFSLEQGEKIGAAFRKLRDIKASQAQQKILRAHNAEEEKENQPSIITRFFNWIGSK